MPHSHEQTRRDFLAEATAVMAAMAGPQSPSTDPTSASAIQLANAIRRRAISSVEVVDAVLARIAAVNGTLNAVVQLDGDRARALAREADRVPTARRGPLHGVPVTIKDSFDTAGIISTGGSWGRRAFVPTEDATVVARLKRAGAIVVGKTNTPELTAGAETNNEVYGRTANPYDSTRSSGGSSGGAGAIIAAGGSPFDVGTDTSGSIRLPAHFCGIAGLKPTQGRLSRSGHILGPEGIIQSITQPGPMARRVEDLALGLAIMAGPDGRDPFLVEQPLGDYRTVRLRDLRVAVFTDNAIITPEPEIVATVRQAAAVLGAVGATVEEARPEGLEAAYQTAFAMMSADGGASLLRVLDQIGTDAEHSALRRQLAAAPAMTSAEFTALLERMDRARAVMTRFLDRFDLIVSPPNAVLPVKHGTDRDRLYAGLSYTVPYNVTGWPAGVVRCGSAGRLPVGVEVIAGPWREDRVLAALALLERELGGWKAP